MVTIIQPSNVYGCTIADDAFIGPFVEVQKNSTIGSKTRVSSHSFICENVHIGVNCFIGHGVTFTNDKFREKKANTRPQEFLKTIVGDNVQIGSNATILPVIIGDNAIIGAGSVVVHNVKENTIVVGNPAKVIGNYKTNTMIRLTDVKRVNEDYKHEYANVLNRVLSSGRYTLGSETLQLETNMKTYVDTEYCIGVGSGSAALELVFQELNLGPDDEFIVQSNAFIASVFPIVQSGCKLVVTDVTLDGEMDIKNVESLITSKTKGILVVHMYGDIVVNMTDMRSLCDENNLFLIEDCAQALGSQISGIQAGSFADMSCFSFYATKNLGAIGEAGAICTNNSEFARSLRKRRNLGCDVRYHHDLIGTNARLDELQAGFINCKFNDLSKFLSLKRCLSDAYDVKLESSSMVSRVKSKNPNIQPSNHLMVVLVEGGYRDELMTFLNENNVEALVHYPIPFHQSTAFSDTYVSGIGTNSVFLSENILTLPMHHKLTLEEVDTICNLILKFEENH